jgi:hypothetical protein
MMFYRPAHERYCTFRECVKRTPSQIITFGSRVRFTPPLARAQKKIYAFARGRVVMGDANHPQVIGVNLYAYFLSTLSNGRLLDGLAALKMSADRPIAPVFKPGVASSRQEDRFGTQQEYVSHNGKLCHPHSGADGRLIARSTPIWPPARQK